MGLARLGSKPVDAPIELFDYRPGASKRTSMEQDADEFVCYATHRLEDEQQQEAGVLGDDGCIGSPDSSCSSRE